MSINIETQAIGNRNKDFKSLFDPKVAPPHSRTASRSYRESISKQKIEEIEDFTQQQLEEIQKYQAKMIGHLKKCGLVSIAKDFSQLFAVFQSSLDQTREQFKQGIAAVRDQNSTSLAYIKDPVELYISMIMKNFFIQLNQQQNELMGHLFAKTFINNQKQKELDTKLDEMRNLNSSMVSTQK